MDVQKIRLIDVFLIAPLLIYAGLRKSNLPVIIRAGLVITGIATLLYNGYNYLRN